MGVLPRPLGRRPGVLPAWQKKGRPIRTALPELYRYATERDHGSKKLIDREDRQHFARLRSLPVTYRLTPNHGAIKAKTAIFRESGDALYLAVPHPHPRQGPVHPGHPARGGGGRVRWLRGRPELDHPHEAGGDGVFSMFTPSTRAPALNRGYAPAVFAARADGAYR